MPRYKVKTPIKHKGKEYKPGQTISLDEAEAAAMPWAVELPKKEKPAAPEEKEEKGKGKK